MWTYISHSLFVPICVLSSSIYFELWQFGDFHCRHLFNSRWRPDTLSIVFGTKFHMKANTTEYMWANFRAFVINIFWDMPDCRYSGRPFEIQDGGQVSCQYQFHTIPNIIWCMCANFGLPAVNIYWNMPDYILTSTIFKLKMAAGYHVYSDGYPASY